MSNEQSEASTSSGNATEPQTPSKVTARRGLMATMAGVLAAGFGVQSSANRERDFQQGKGLHFIIGGLLGTLAFILFVVFLVRMVIAMATP